MQILCDTIHINVQMRDCIHTLQPLYIKKSMLIQKKNTSSPVLDRWLHRVCRQCTAPLPMGTCAAHVHHESVETMAPSQMDSLLWLAL